MQFKMCSFIAPVFTEGTPRTLLISVIRNMWVKVEAAEIMLLGYKNF